MSWSAMNRRGELDAVRGDKYLEPYALRYLYAKTHLDIKLSGDCTSTYWFKVEKIRSSGHDIAPDIVDMGYFDEPRPVALDVFGPHDLVDEEYAAPGPYVIWPKEDQRTPTFKWFQISLGRSLKVGEQYAFRFRVEEPLLFNCSKETEYWDNDVMLPSEQLEVSIDTPKGLVVRNPRLKCRENSGLQLPTVSGAAPRQDGRFTIEYSVRRPSVALKYELEWDWSPWGIDVPRTKYCQVFNGWEGPFVHSMEQVGDEVKRYEILVDERTEQVYRRGALVHRVKPGSMLYHMLHVLAEIAEVYESRCTKAKLRELLEHRLRDHRAGEERRPPSIDVGRWIYMLRLEFPELDPARDQRSMIRGLETGGYMIAGRLPVYILRAM